MSGLRVGIVGLGMAAPPHIHSLRRLAKTIEIARVYTRSAERREAFGRENPDIPMADSEDAIVHSPDIDAILLLTPPSVHLEGAEKIALAGKHLLIEKPLDVSTERARRIVELFEENNLRLGVVLQKRFIPAIRRLEEMVQAGRLGKIVGASLSFPTWRPQSYYDQEGRGTKARDGGGVLLTQSIHIIDAFLSIVPAPSEVFAHARTSSVHDMETEDIVAAVMEFEGGAIGTLDTTTAAYPGFAHQIRIVGTQGTAVLTDADLAAHFLDGSQEQIRESAVVRGNGEDPMAFSFAYHEALIEDFAAAVEGAREPRASGRHALRTQRFIDALLQSAQTRQPVALSA